jgi:predicted TIM-barrel fold metal-dependent hydrolase
VVVQPSVYGTDNACTVDAVRRITAEQIRGLNWHVQVYTRTSVIAALKDHLARMPFPVVIDHFGRGNPAQVPAQPDFAIRRRLRENLRRLSDLGQGARLCRT